MLKYRIVPSDLGLPYRLPGIWPFINFIRDDVFLRYVTQFFVFEEFQLKLFRFLSILKFKKRWLFINRIDSSLLFQIWQSRLQTFWRKMANCVTMSSNIQNFVGTIRTVDRRFWDTNYWNSREDFCSSKTFRIRIDESDVTRIEFVQENTFTSWIWGTLRTFQTSFSFVSTVKQSSYKNSYLFHVWCCSEQSRMCSIRWKILMMK